MQHHHRRGFTLIELLIVISIILVLLSMGMFALGGLNTPPLEESANTVRSAMSIARQYSVTHGVPVYVVFKDYGESVYSTLDPAAGSVPADKDKWDMVSVYPVRMIKDLSPEAGKTLVQSPPTGTISYALDLVNEPLMQRELIKPVEYDYLPGHQIVSVLTVEGVPPAASPLPGLHVIRFNPNGTCDSKPAVVADPVIPTDRPTVGVNPTNSIRLSNFIALHDVVEDKRLYVYVYPSTCYVHIRGD